MIQIALYVLLGIIVIAGLRVILGPTVWDRLLGLNLIAAKVLIAIVLLASLLGESYLLDIALVYAVLGFIGTVLIARFFDRRDGS
jgi:multicomponent Na+:H+ antiporter subunit F